MHCELSISHWLWEEKWFFFLLLVSFDSLLIAKDMPAPAFLNNQEEPNHCLLKVYAPAVSTSVTWPLWEVWTPRCATALLLHTWVMTTILSLLFMGSWVVEVSPPSDPLPWEPLHQATHMVAGFIRVTQGECECQKKRSHSLLQPNIGSSVSSLLPYSLPKRENMKTSS